MSFSIERYPGAIVICDGSERIVVEYGEIDRLVECLEVCKNDRRGR